MGWFPAEVRPLMDRRVKPKNHFCISFVSIYSGPLGSNVLTKSANATDPNCLYSPRKPQMPHIYVFKREIIKQ